MKASSSLLTLAFLAVIASSLAGEGTKRTVFGAQTKKTIACSSGKAKEDTNQSRRDAQGDPLPVGALARFGTIRLRHGERVGALAYSQDGKLLASGGHDGTVSLWDTVSGKRLRQFFIKRQPQVHYVAFLPGDKKLVALSGKFPALLWDLESGECLREIGPKMEQGRMA
jgi:WD40 repeat protein